MVIGRVYMIISPAGKVYIGSTKQYFKTRWRSYYNLSCKWQRKLLNSLKFYGPENHIFIPMWEGDASEMLKQEAILGRIYKVLDKNQGLNCKLPKESEIYSSMCKETKDKISQAHIGKKHTEETKQKLSIQRKLLGMSEAHKKILAISRIGKMNHSEETKLKMSNSQPNKRIVLQYDLEGNFIKEWSSIINASKALNISSAAIVRYLKGQILEPKKFKWKYKN